MKNGLSEDGLIFGYQGYQTIILVIILKLEQMFVFFLFYDYI